MMKLYRNYVCKSRVIHHAYPYLKKNKLVNLSLLFIILKINDPPFPKVRTVILPFITMVRIVILPINERLTILTFVINRRITALTNYFSEEDPTQPFNEDQAETFGRSSQNCTLSHYELSPALRSSQFSIMQP